MHKKSCCIPFCASVRYVNENSENKPFFNFNNQTERDRRWTEILKSHYPELTNAMGNQYICHEHFSEKNFTSTLKNRLIKFAVPDLLTDRNLLNNSKLLETESCDEVNPLSNVDHAHLLEPSTSGENNNNILFHKKQQGILKQCGVKCAKNLSETNKAFYHLSRNQQSTIIRLKRSITKSKHKQQAALRITSTKLFKQLEASLSEPGVELIKSQFINAQKKKRGQRWTLENKIFALALYKRGPRSYRFLQRFLRLPGKSTLQEILSDIPFDTGINKELFKHLGNIIGKLNLVDRCSCLMFDEISLSRGFTYNNKLKKNIGYVDLGANRRANLVANHALVFMISGLHKAWKQPIAYYFTKDQISTIELKRLIIELIEQLQSIGVRVVCCVCDQGSTNAAALKQLIEEYSSDKPGPYFIVNGEVTVAVHDPPHLLKNTRNALMKYDIEFEKNKIAKWQHIVDCLEFDKRRIFQCLPRLHKENLMLQKSYMKMRVCIAARTLSYTMAAALETFSITSLSSEVVLTATFIEHVDRLFDSVNGRTPYPEKGKEMRACVSKTSKHREFWYNMLKQIKMWNFLDKKGNKVTPPRCKMGWIQTIQGFIMIWDICQEAGFKFLRTRAINQDPLENLFSIIRQYGGGNDNPTCYQFTSALKTSILNGLISHRSKGKNCEDDDIGVLDDLNAFIRSCAKKCDLATAVYEEEISVLAWNVPNKPEDLDFIDLQAVTYVSGYIVKRIKSECKDCDLDLLSSETLPEHTFTTFKEFYTEKEHLKYARKELIYSIIHIQRIIYKYLEEHGHDINVYQKLSVCISENVIFEWLQCVIHKLCVKSKIVDLVLNMLFKKFYRDLERSDKYRKRKY